MCWATKLAADPDFATNVERVKRRAETDRPVAAVFRSLACRALTHKLAAADIAFAPGQRSGRPCAPSASAAHRPFATPGGRRQLPAPPAAASADPRALWRGAGAGRAHRDGARGVPARTLNRGHLRRYVLRCRRRRMQTSWMRTAIHPLADIGGTNSRLALAGPSGRPEHVVIIENDSGAGPRRRDRRAISIETGVRPRAAVLAVAAPLDRRRRGRADQPCLAVPPQRARAAVRISPSARDQRLRGDRLVAVAARRRRTHGRSARASRRARGVKAVLGPGTGLGVAALVPTDGRSLRDVERGRACLVRPASPDEIEIFERLFARARLGQRRNHPVRPGLVRLMRARRSRHAPSHAAGAGRGRACGRPARAGDRATVRAPARPLCRRPRADLQGARRRLYRRRRRLAACAAARRAGIPRGLRERIRPTRGCCGTFRRC